MEPIKDFFIRVADYLEFSGLVLYKLIEKIIGYSLGAIAGVLVAIAFTALLLFSCFKELSDQLESEWKSLKAPEPTPHERLVWRIGLHK
ncbi:MAG: hypothetical protein AAB388_02730 [Patescibacteria group bacterium]